MGTLPGPVSPSAQNKDLRMSSAFLLGLILGVATAHEYFPEKCPEFTPMQAFDWDQFANGVWYVTQKFATRSTCLTYEFTTDELGFKEITQLRQLPYSEKVGLDHEYKYTGKLYAANEALPAKMNVRFPLNPIGAASFVVLDTDYTSYGLICTCQEIDLFITTGHRRSCSMLQRAVEEEEAITSKLTELLDSQVPDSSHDFPNVFVLNSNILCVCHYFPNVFVLNSNILCVCINFPNVFVLNSNILCVCIDLKLAFKCLLLLLLLLMLLLLLLLCCCC